MISRLKIALRINLLLALAAFGMVACAAIGLWGLRAHLLEEKRAQLSSLMELVITDARGDMADAGGPQTEPGRAAFVKVIKSAKFDGNPANYFFIYDYDGVAVWNPDPAKQGRDRSNAVFPNGVKMVPRFIEGARNAPLGEFFEFEGWDGGENSTPKLAYFRDAPELKVVVGVGVNIKAINAAYLDRFHSMAWLFASVMLAIGFLSAVISRSISRPLSNAIGKITNLAKGDLDIAPANAGDKSELGEVDNALDILRANAIEQKALQAKVQEQNELLLQQHKENEERLRQFVEQAPAAITMLDRDMRHLACSRRWLYYYGLKAEEVIGRSRYDICPDMPEYQREAHRKAMAGEPVRVDEDILTRADGSSYWQRVDIYPWLKGDGNIGGITIMVEDVTEKVTAVRALRESEERQSFLLSLNDALRAEFDPVETIAIASEKLARKLAANQVLYAEIDETGTHATISRDWSDGEAFGAFKVHNLSDFDPSFIQDLKSSKTVHIDDVRSDPRFQKPEVLSIFERGSVASAIVVPLVKGGKLAAVLAVHKREAYAWKDDEVSLAQDVAERTWEAVERARVSQALHESDERLKFAIEAADVGSWELFLEAKTYLASDRALAFLDFPSGTQPRFGEILDRTHPDDRTILDEAFRRAVESSRPFKIEFRRLRADGSELWLEARGERRSLCGKPVIGGLIQDITDRVNQKEAVERAARAQAEFLASMSHELRTPMHAILSFAKFGVKKCGTADIKTIEEYFDTIQTSGKRLLALLNDLLDLAKLESGKMVLHQTDCDFAEIIEHTRRELKPLLDDKKLTLTTHIVANDTKAEFDKQRVTQVLINLISNSIKFSASGGNIRVTLSEEAGGAEGIRCSVGDEGPGIPQSELEAVFDKFIQSSKTKSGGGGTGLGLSICREIMKAHGGRIWAENGAPRGAMFTFVIPKNGPAVANLPAGLR